MIVPGPDGRLISTQERLEHVRQNQSGEPADGRWQHCVIADE